MTEKLGRAELELATNQSTYDKGLADAERKGKGFLDRVGQSINGLHKSAGWGAVMQGVGLGAGLTVYGAISNAIGGTIDYLKGAISAASALGETVSKVRIVFGESADAVLAFGETSADSLGVSESAALSAAGTYGNLFRAMGITEEASSGMSISLVRLAADLASFNDMNPTEVLDKLRAGLSGETEPLRTLGVNLNMARIQAKALELGLWDGTEAIDAAAKAQATYALILEDTALAQGDIGRTAGSLANQQRFLTAELDEFSADVGALAVGPVTELVVVLNAWLDLLPKIEEGTEAAADAAGPFGEFFDQPLIDILHDLGFLQDEIRYTFTELPQDLYQIQTQGAGQVTAGARAMAHGIEEEARNARLNAAREARGIPGDIAKALRDGQRDVESGVAALLDLMENSLSDAAKIAYYQGVLVDPAIAAALLDERADVRDAAKEVVADAQAQLDLLQSGAADAAVDTGTTLAEQLRLQRVKAGLAAADVAQTVRSNLAFDATQTGTNIVTTLSAGITAAARKAEEAAQYVRNKVSGVLEFAGSPAYTHAREIGEGVMDAWIGGIQSRLARDLDISPAIAAFGLAGAGGEGVGTALAAGGGREVHYHYELQVDGLPKEYGDREDFIRDLQAISTFGPLKG